MTYLHLSNRNRIRTCKTVIKRCLKLAQIYLLVNCTSYTHTGTMFRHTLVSYSRKNCVWYGPLAVKSVLLLWSTTLDCISSEDIPMSTVISQNSEKISQNNFVQLISKKKKRSNWFSFQIFTYVRTYAI